MTTTDISQTGFAKADAYDQHRPRYPAQSVQKLLDECRVANVHGAKILDLAAGTGIFTEALAARDEQFEIIAVEPHDAMREVLAGKNLPRVTVHPGRADSIPVADESIDAVLVAQAFHWFANEATLKEIHRVLRPHGCIGLVWNAEDWNAAQDHAASTAWEGKVHDLTWSFKDQQPRYRDGQWRQVFENQVESTPMSLLVAADPLFALPLGEHWEQWTVWLSKEQAWRRYRTLSHIAVLEGDELERTHNAFMDAINGPDVETNASGDIAVHGTTHTVFTSKVPA